MARRVFFSFHYERDLARAIAVRNSWVTRDRMAEGFWDDARWNEARARADFRSLIDDGLLGTSVTAVLIGAETSHRTYVRHAIQRSHNQRNGILGVYVHGIADNTGSIDVRGRNPFEEVFVEQDGRRIYLSRVYPTYDWVADNGYANFGRWVEEAARLTTAARQ